MEKTLVIFAAGIGHRYGGLKQMDPVGPSGEFIIDYSVFDALRAGFNKVVFVIRRDIDEEFKSAIGARVEHHIRTEYAFQELSDLPSPFCLPPGRVKPWGTVQALLACADLVSSPFAAINADDFYGRESYEVLSKALDATSPDSREYSMVGFKLRNTLSDYGSVTRGLCRADSEGYLQSTVEVSGIERRSDGAYMQNNEGFTETLTGEELVSMNFWGFTPSVFGPLRNLFVRFLESSLEIPKSEFVVPTSVNELVSDRIASVRILQTGSVWFGITHPEDKTVVANNVARLIDAGAYPEKLWS